MLLRLLSDFGLLVLIWLVQLVIYPAFKYQSPLLLQKWHKIYTSRITVVVIPLMLFQLTVSIVQLWKEVNFYTSGSLILVLLVWILTFSVFVPLHSTIEKDSSQKEKIDALISKNWMRTIIWSALFLWTFAHFLRNFHF